MPDYNVPSHRKTERAHVLEQTLRLCMIWTEYTPSQSQRFTEEPPPHHHHHHHLRLLVALYGRVRQVARRGQRRLVFYAEQAGLVGVNPVAGATYWRLV